MTPNFRIVAIAFLCLSATVNAQQEPIDRFTFLDKGFDHNWEPNSLMVSGGLEIGSNAVNSTMFSDYLLRETFTPRAKEQFVGLENDRSNIYTIANADLEYKLTNKMGVYVSSSSQLFFSSGSDFTKVLLFGNAPFAGEEVKTKNTTFINTSSHSFGVSHLLINSEKWRVKSRYGVNAITRYNELNADEVSIYTDKDGEYIDFSISNATYSEASDGIEAIGLDLDVAIDYSVNARNEVSLAVNNIQPSFFLDKQLVTIDTSFRFEGLEFNPFAADSGQSFANYIDSNLNELTRNKEDMTFALLPSQLKLTWTRYLNSRNTLIVQLSTVQLGRYGYHSRVSHNYKFGPNLKLQTTIAFGNYASLQWNEAVDYRASEKISLYAKAIGINSMFVPNRSHSYGVVIGFANRF